MVTTSDGGYAIAGYTRSYGAGSEDFWLVKTDSIGNAMWNKTYGGAADEDAYSVIVTSDGGYAIAGYTRSYGAGSEDFWLVKTDSAGNKLWNKTYGGADRDEAHSVVQTNDGGYALGGIAHPWASSYQFKLVKTDSAGNIQWNKAYGGSADYFAHSMIQTSDGGYALAGIKFSVIPFYADFLLIKTDAAGNMQWNKTYGGAGSEEAFSLVQTSDRGYALAGTTDSYGAGGTDFWLVKLTPATIYIRGDGSVDPPTAPIQRNGDIYTLTDNIYTETIGIQVGRNNMTLDGAGHTLQGPGSGYNYGIDLSNISNITIKNANIKNFYWGIYTYSTSFCNFFDNNVTTNNCGIDLYISSSSNISGNIITASTNYGISLFRVSISIVCGNKLISDSLGIGVDKYSNHNDIFGNNITENYYGIYAIDSYDNRIFHNNFVSNTNQVINSNATNIWDCGYPSGGNYWSDYTGTDTHRGVFQNITGSDGISDTNYTLNANNIDHYPLMGLFSSVTKTGKSVTVIPADDVALIFENVTTEGSTTVNKTSTGPESPPNFKLLGQYYDIKTTAVYSGKIQIRITYNDSSTTPQQEATLQLLHWNESTSSWDNITTYVDSENNVIYGETDSFSIFGVTGASLTGDANGDLKVDGKDVAIVAKAFNTKPGDDKWDPRADFNSDGKVDGKDVAIVSKYFNTHYP
jgi:parallel beta-helix repeat protein